MDRSHLSGLPPEIRNRIYELVLKRPSGRYILGNAGPRPFAHNVPLALTRVCRQIRGEASAMFYALNRFTILIEFLLVDIEATILELQHIFDSRTSWLELVGNEHAKKIRHVTIDLGPDRYESEQREILTRIGIALQQLEAYRRMSTTPCPSLRLAFEVRFYGNESQDDSWYFGSRGHHALCYDISLASRTEARLSLCEGLDKALDTAPQLNVGRGFLSDVSRWHEMIFEMVMHDNWWPMAEVEQQPVA